MQSQTSPDGQTRATHTQAFNTYLASLALLPADAVALQVCLESYAGQESALTENHKYSNVRLPRAWIMQFSRL